MHRDYTVVIVGKQHCFIVTTFVSPGNAISFYSYNFAYLIQNELHNRTDKLERFAIKYSSREFHGDIQEVGPFFRLPTRIETGLFSDLPLNNRVVKRLH